MAGPADACRVSTSGERGGLSVTGQRRSKKGSCLVTLGLFHTHTGFSCNYKQHKCQSHYRSQTRPGLVFTPAPGLCGFGPGAASQMQMCAAGRRLTGCLALEIQLLDTPSTARTARYRTNAPKFWPRFRHPCFCMCMHVSCGFSVFGFRRLQPSATRSRLKQASHGHSLSHLLRVVYRDSLKGCIVMGLQWLDFAG